MLFILKILIVPVIYLGSLKLFSMLRDISLILRRNLLDMEKYFILIIPFMITIIKTV